MASLALPTWTHPRHPIVHGETRHWQRSRFWRAARAVLWGGSLLFLAVPAACTLLIGLAAPSDDPVEAILAGGGTFAFALAVVSGVASGLASLLAGLLGATLISRERECRSWPFLRLTTLTTIEIVGGKFAALLYSLARPLHFAVGLRLLALLAGALTLAAAAAAAGVDPAGLSTLWAEVAREVDSRDLFVLQLSTALSLPLALGWWLLEPYVSAVYGGAVGLAASCLARSRGAGIVLTVAVHFGLGLGLYAPVQQVMSAGLLYTLQDANRLVIALLPALAVALPLVVHGALQVVVIGLCFVLAVNRAERLGE